MGSTSSGASSAGSGSTGSTGSSGASTAGSTGSAWAGAHLALELHRADGGTPGQLVAVVRAVDDGGLPVDGLPVEVQAAGGAAAAVGQGGGLYAAQLSAPFSSGELPVRAGLAGGDGGPSLTAVVLPAVGPDWDVPLAVGGLVNSPGDEDSPTISPDGEWLIVGTYSPVDAFCCLLGCGAGPADGRNAACQAALGPVDAPARPAMPGAERVLSPTRIVDAAPNLCLAGPDGGDFAIPVPDGGVLVPVLPPATAYGFHRQPDGTFADPFPIHFDDDGFFGGPYCFSFVTPVSNGQAGVILANAREDQAGAPHQPAFAVLNLGVENVLGSYACAGGPRYTPGAVFPLPVAPAAQNAGNTSLAGGYLWSDDETQSPAAPLVSQQLPDGGYSPWGPLALPEAGDDRRQPVLFNGRLYYYRNASVASASWSGADPGQRGSFGAPQVELAGDPVSPTGLLGLSPGQVFGVGQPTFAARPGGATEMYFVYVRRTATGFDSQIGMVRSR